MDVANFNVWKNVWWSRSHTSFIYLKPSAIGSKRCILIYRRRNRLVEWFSFSFLAHEGVGSGAFEAKLTDLLAKCGTSLGWILHRLPFGRNHRFVSPLCNCWIGHLLWFNQSSGCLKKWKNFSRAFRKEDVYRFVGIRVQWQMSLSIW